MSDAIQSFSVLYNNPFIFGPLFPSFYSSLGEKPKSILLSYLILPLVLYPDSRKFLVNATSRSSVMTMVGRPGKRDRLYGLDERIAEYRDLTNASFQHEIDIGTLLVSENLSVDVASKWPSDPPCSSDYHKASRRLGLLFAPFDVPTVYRMIGVKRL